MYITMREWLLTLKIKGNISIETWRVNGKWQTCLCAIETYGTEEVQFQALLTSSLDRGEWSVSYNGHLTARKTAPVTHWIGGWVGPRTSLEALTKRKISCLCWESIHDSSDVQPAAQSLYWVRYPSTWTVNNNN
jgi:hypothetical protein